MASRSLCVLASASLATLTAAGCGGGDSVTIADSVSDVTTADGSIHATYVSGSLPGEGAGPSLAVSTNAAIIPGGTAPAVLTADAAFTRVVLAIDGADGYYLLTLPAGVTSTDVVLTLTQDLFAPTFDWVYGVGTDAGFGAFVLSPVNVLEVGTGDVQVSLSWNTPADVDLHVVDPANEEILWLHRASASGGALDLDSNAGCFSDGPRNENITWPVHGAPDGTYQVLVDYWSACSQAETAFTVAVNRVGAPVETFSGTFTGPGDSGGYGSGQPITTFTVGGSSVAGITAAPRDHAMGTIEVAPVPGATLYAK